MRMDHSYIQWLAILLNWVIDDKYVSGTYEDKRIAICNIFDIKRFYQMDLLLKRRTKVFIKASMHIFVFWAPFSSMV